MTIHILCYRCGSHIADTDVARLDWPLRGEMFDVKAPGWYLRAGLINLDIFCPVCTQFPFHWDTSLPGAVGKALNIKGPDGKPVVMTVKQILMSQGTGVPALYRDGGTPRGPGETIGGDDSQTPEPAQAPQPVTCSEWPCPECGAKKRFHKAGCSKKSGVEPQVASPDQQPSLICPGCDQQVTNRHEGHKAGCPVIKGFMSLVPDKEVQGHGESVFKSVKKGADTGEGPPTPEEIAQMESDRESRGTPDPVKEEGKAVHLEGKEPRYLRPGEQYVPKGA